MKKLIQQGDVLLRPTALTTIPEGLVPVTTHNWLREGEVTGHAHRLSSLNGTDGGFTIYADSLGMPKFLKVVDPFTALSHEEHDPFLIPPGVYDIAQVVEFDPTSEDVRPVLD
jgi:hypothetical protein